MPKNDNAHSLRLTESLRQHAGEAAARDFEAKLPLSKSADIEKKFAWAKAACEYLEGHFDADTRAAIRKGCSCNDGSTNAAKLQKYLKQAGSIREFVEAFNQHESFASLTYLAENRLLFCYPQCYCSCVKRMPQPISQTWCCCTLGNAQKMFQKVFQKKVKVSLRETIKSGGARCEIEVEW